MNHLEEGQFFWLTTFLAVFELCEVLFRLLSAASYMALFLCSHCLLLLLAFGLLLSISVPAVVGVKVLICFRLLTLLCVTAQDDFYSVMAVFDGINSSCFNF